MKKILGLTKIQIGRFVIIFHIVTFNITCIYCRSVYTRKILEIIGNIKKQDEEIKKILKDTKEVQKDINNLNGQLDRSFTLSDELIFRVNIIQLLTFHKI